VASSVIWDIVGVQDDLADADGLRGDLDALVFAGELEGLFEGQVARRRQVLEGVGGSGTHVGELLFLGDVDVHVVGAGVLADDHALVDLGGGLHEEGAALLQVDHGERRHNTGAVGDHRTVGAVLDRTGPRLVALGDGCRDAGAAGVREELGAEADQATGGNDELHAAPAGAVVGHVGHAALAGCHELRDGAEVFFRHVDGHVLHRLVDLAVDGLGDNLRLADGQLEAFTAHLLDEDGQRELATALDFPGVGTLGGRTLMETLPISSLSRRSFTWRAVTLAPLTLPASGEVLIPMVMEIAGSSTVISGSGCGFSASVRVSPMVISSMPATATISPGPADSAGTRSSALVARSSVILTFLSSPLARTQATVWPLRRVPL
jgi:hypothetical protein